jgi:hypothetical protein
MKAPPAVVVFRVVTTTIVVAVLLVMIGVLLLSTGRSVHQSSTGAGATAARVRESALVTAP